VGWAVEAPLPIPPVFELIRREGDVSDEEMYEVFNMGCGFVAVVPAEQAVDAAALLASHHPGAAVIGQVTGEAGTISRPA
jgi:phosphoribosylformylglycinamidine cyclo-ligase